MTQQTVLQMTAEAQVKKELRMKRMLWLSLFLMLLPTVSAFSQEKPDSVCAGEAGCYRPEARLA